MRKSTKGLLFLVMLTLISSIYPAAIKIISAGWHLPNLKDKDDNIVLSTVNIPVGNTWILEQQATCDNTIHGVSGYFFCKVSSANPIFWQFDKNGLLELSNFLRYLISNIENLKNTKLIVKYKCIDKYDSWDTKPKEFYVTKDRSYVHLICCKTE